MEEDFAKPTPQEPDPGTPPPIPEQPQPAGTPPDKDACLWATFTHLAAFAGLLGIPFGSIIGPLVLWLIKKNEMPFVDYSGKEALNFQISITIYMIASLPLLCGGPLVLVAWIPLGIVAVIFTIIAAIKANNGEYYRYPITIRIIK
jgi:uncharacterized Tic20 family protein